MHLDHEYLNIPPSPHLSTFPGHWQLPFVYIVAKHPNLDDFEQECILLTVVTTIVVFSKSRTHK